MHKHFRLQAILLLFSIFTNCTYGQDRFKLRIMEAIHRSDTREALRLIDSSAFSVRKRLMYDGNFDLVHFSLLADSLSAFDSVYRRATFTKTDDLWIAAKFANKRRSFQTISDKVFDTNLDNYAQTIMMLLRPFTDSIRKEARSLLIAYARQEIEDEEEEEADEYGDDNPGPRRIRFSEITDLFDTPNYDSDTISLKEVLGKVAQFATKDTILSLVTDVALTEELISPSAGSRYLMDKYIYPAKTLRGDFLQQHFTESFEKGKWYIVDMLINKGVAADLTQVNVEKVEDPDRAVGYFVRLQLVDPNNQSKAVLANRSWTYPKSVVTIPGTPGKPFSEIAERHPGLEVAYGPSLAVGGGAAQVIFQGKPLCKVEFQMNFKMKLHWSSLCSDGYTVTIPGSDTTSGGEYNAITIRNTGVFIENDIQIPEISKSKQPIQIFRKGILVATIPVGGEKTLNRAFGPLELRTVLENGRFFGFIATFPQQLHGPLGEYGVSARLRLYHRLLQLREPIGDLMLGSSESWDAKTEKRLVSDQLFEGVPIVLKGELRQAMQTLAEEADFTAKFTDLIYALILGTDITGALEIFLQSPDPEIRNQAAILQAALQRRIAALSLLHDKNISAYASRVQRVQNLIYELAQYYPKEELLNQLHLVIKELTPQAQARFQNNTISSKRIWTINDTDLEGKGAVVKQFLGL